ncbi:MAG: bifunctional folylpolyglutamate synthase/dihydrofolate synthase [Candidatus Omnitrophica bacterium]|nr:bifunctional folylpolyglutamate synthase/dihydrofolate synthase [Candidatus Omnitrophota bacterium]
MTFPEIIKYLESFINYEKKPTFCYKRSLKLKRFKDFLKLIHNPQNSLKVIHIAGTKGKGSTCAFLTYILREAGYKVGLYTSPHLSDFRERIRILKPKGKNQKPKSDFEGMISKNELVDLTQRLKPQIERYNQNSKYGTLSFFEVYTALAFVYFNQKNVDFVVLETGLGGRLDATNVVRPLVCAITPISYEHTQKLGNTLSEIAIQKAGIIKKGVTVISAPQEEEAAKVIRDRCRQVKAKLRTVGKDLRLNKRLKINLLGDHQIINANVAVEAIKALGEYGIKISQETIKNGLYNTKWPGRCEVVAYRPSIVLDGAQNVASAKALRQTIKKNFKYKRLILVLGVSGDKDIKGIAKEFYHLADKIVLTKANNPRAASLEKLAQYFAHKELYFTQNVKEAKTKALNLARQRDLILVTGSLFVVGEFRALMKGQGD